MNPFTALASMVYQWWQHSSISKWYVQRLLRTHAINPNHYVWQHAPTFFDFLQRKLKNKPLLSPHHASSMVSPVEGKVEKSTPTTLTLTMLPYHYHRIHLPIGGKITHTTNNTTQTTIQLTHPYALQLTIIITTPHHPDGIQLRYNPERNYHLPGTEIGIITAPRGTIIIQSSAPILYAITTTELSLLSPIAGTLNGEHHFISATRRETSCIKNYSY